MRPVDVIARYADAEIGVLLQHREKLAGDLGSLYWVGCPSMADALEAVADDLFEGRVEKITADGEELPEDIVVALMH